MWEMYLKYTFIELWQQEPSPSRCDITLQKDPEILNVYQKFAARQQILSPSLTLRLTMTDLKH